MPKKYNKKTKKHSKRHSKKQSKRYSDKNNRKINQYGGGVIIPIKLVPNLGQIYVDTENIKTYEELKNKMLDEIINEGPVFDDRYNFNSFVYGGNEIKLESELKKEDIAAYINNVALTATFTSKDYIAPIIKKNTYVTVKVLEINGDNIYSPLTLNHRNITFDDGVDVDLRTVKSRLNEQYYKDKKYEVNYIGFALNGIIDEENYSDVKINDMNEYEYSGVKSQLYGIVSSK